MRRAPLALLLASSLLSCGKAAPVGGVMLGVRTDLEVPARVDSVGIYIQRIEGDRITPLAPIERRVTKGADGVGRVHLPGTLAIENPGDPNVRIRVRVVAYDDAGTVLVMRESRVRVPNDRLASLPLPLLWMNTDDVVDANPAAGGPAVDVASGSLDFLQAASSAPVAAFDRFRSDFCGEGRTLDDSGACREVDIEVDDLPDYEPTPPATESEGGVRGDATANATRAFCSEGVKSTCFDVARCFANDDDPNYQPLEVPTDSIEGLGTASCSVVLSDAPDMQVPDVALAVRTTEAEGAICVSEGVCYIPIDSASGFSIDAAGRRITLPPGVCRKAQKGKVLSIVASPLCDRQQAAEPTCMNAGCLDGSGWDLGRDPGVPREDGGIDAGTDAGDICTRVAGATGFWVGDDRITLLGGDYLSRYLPSQLTDDCLVGDADSTVAIGSVAPSTVRLLARVPYRLLGPSDANLPGTVAFSSATFDDMAPTAGLLGPSGLPIVVPVQSNQVAFQGAAFVTQAASGDLRDTVVFLGLRSDGMYSYVRRTEVFGASVAVGSDLWLAPGVVDKPSNVIANRTQPGVLQAVRAAGKLGLVICDSSCVLKTSTIDGEPVFLASAPDGTPTLLARDASDHLFLLTADDEGILVRDPARSFTTGGADLPEETTFAMAGPVEAPVTYLATRTTLVSKVGVEPAVREVSLTEGQLHAVQTRAGQLYWLQSDAAGQASLHRRTLDLNGRTRTVP